MKMMRKLLPLFVAVILGTELGEAASCNHTVASVSKFSTNSGPLFLKHVQRRFDNSLNYLLTGNFFSGQSVERPGLAKVLREESDRQWNLGIEALKKFLQRGGDSDHNRFKNHFKFNGKVHDACNSDSKAADFSATYLVQLEDLVTDRKDDAVQINDLVRKLLSNEKQQENDAKEFSLDDAENNKCKTHRYDAEMVHFLQEKMEEEVGLLHKFSNLFTNLKMMANLSLAQYVFDKSLSG